MSLSASAPVQADRSAPPARGEACNPRVSGPSDLHSPAHANSASTTPAAAPGRPQPDPNPFFSGTACGSRSTRPTGVR